MLSADGQKLRAWYRFSLTVSERVKSAKTLISNSGFQNSKTRSENSFCRSSRRLCRPLS